MYWHPSISWHHLASPTQQKDLSIKRTEVLTFIFDVLYLTLVVGLLLIHRNRASCSNTKEFQTCFTRDGVVIL